MQKDRNGLPPGQRRVDGFPRFGAHLSRPAPAVPVDPVIAMCGALTDGVDLPAQVAFGAEYSFSNVIFARVGKKFYNDDRSPDSDFQYGLSGGFGVRIPVMQRDLRFDYSYTSLGDLQNIQILSFEFGR